MARALHRGLNERRLRGWLLVFFVALSIPIALLVLRANAQMKWEVFHQWRVSAEELSARIDTDVRALLSAEEARSFGDYAFLSVAGDPGATYLQRSPLSAFPVNTDVPGVIGYFQVDRAGALSSPTVPDRGTAYDDYGVSEAEYEARVALNERLGRILGSVASAASGRDYAFAERVARRRVVLEQRIVSSADDVAVKDGDKAPASSNVFDRLSKSVGEVAGVTESAGSYARVDELELDERREQKSRQQRSSANLMAPAFSRKRESRKEQVASFAPAEEAVAQAVAPALEAEVSDMPAAVTGMRADAVTVAPAPVLPGKSKKADIAPRVRFFDGEIDPFTFAVLDAAHFVLFRNVWREGERFIQGAVIERAAFIEGIILRAYQGTALAGMSRLIVAYDGNVISEAGREAARGSTRQAGDLSGELLYRTRLSAPFAAVELLYTVTDLPPGPGARYLAWVGFVLALILVGGFFVIYRYGVGQITLFRQQQDFVSAVSHELKTPLTSIRMYSEILQAGWADEEKKSGYYTFIHDESERLSRLISNVLQLSRITRGNHTVDLKTQKARELLDVARSKISSQIASSGFNLQLDCDEAALDAEISADTDAFTQVIINLVDNAIKFCPDEAERRIDITCRTERDNRLCFSVRDYGRGIAKNQMRKIFELFYRPESELTRETVGTGIGLALVRQLIEAMGGRIDVRNREPGVEFLLSFPLVH